MHILGISAFYHDSAAALLTHGEIVAAAQEERFTRVKHDAGFPTHAVRFCLDFAGIRLRDVEFVVFYEKPLLKFERLLETYLGIAPAGLRSFQASMPLWIQEKLFQRDHLTRWLQSLDPEWRGQLLFTEHHQSHAASAFYASGFDQAVVLTMDGVGEWPTTSVALGSRDGLKTLREIHFPHSLGLLYSAFTYYCGFKVNSGEYKLMGLAPYGRPVYTDLIRRHLIDVKPDGSFRLDMRYFDYCGGLTMTSPRFHQLFKREPRRPEELLTQEHMDLAASIQQVLEEVVLRMTRSLAVETGIPNLCLAGGVALNCVANGKILRDGAFRNLWIQPAAGDAGGALGAALAVHHLHLGHAYTPSAGGGDRMRGSYLGPEFTQADIEQRLYAAGAEFERLTWEQLLDASVEDLAAERALGWFQGRMEFGPRALGARSILGDARSPAMQSVLNLKVKYRESFRPFAPSVLREKASQWFELEGESPYMLLVADVPAAVRLPVNAEQEALFGIEKLKVPRSRIPAVTHVDYSARIQTVSADTNPRYHQLLARFDRATGCPVLVNTSFNVRGEPIVCTPEDAFACFMGTGIESLAIGNCYLRKSRQNPELLRSYQGAFSPD